MGSLARLRSDVGALFRATPHPDIILPDGGPSDLTTITITLLGPSSTPYAEGAWKVRLIIPQEYPNSPPKAYFETKIFHPNVAPRTGEVCVDTLKRDWTSSVDLRHVLMVIRCLLIEPNPESALNEEAGKLLLENFEDFERMARIMTSVHALKRSTFSAVSTAAASSASNSSANAKSTTVAKIYSDAPTNPTLIRASSEDITNPCSSFSSSSSSSPKNVLQPLAQQRVPSPLPATTTISPAKPKRTADSKKKKVGIKRL
ncbi:ubiquitin-conjugating enzyme/RWD-like protein [Lipomyces oligophaga]|uniref:ubiquitin-conjugating enzyme/RWD-like protein n=1 Tax=Lipomyces oligophaga TaxID=45792 RepID=UPI0034CE3096